MCKLCDGYVGDVGAILVCGGYVGTLLFCGDVVRCRYVVILIQCRFVEVMWLLCVFVNGWKMFVLGCNILSQ